MSRKRPDQQLPLPLPTTRRRIGRVEQAVARSIRVAQAAGEIEAVHGGACALARSLAARVDAAESRQDPWAAAACSRELRETLAALGLDRASRGDLAHADTGSDAFAALLAEFTAPATGDAPQP